MKRLSRGEAMKPSGWIAVLVFGVLGSGCTVDEVPAGLKRTPPGSGPLVRFDLYHQPLPEIPLPNDAAMWPDPTSRTGLRINASVVAATDIEVVARQKFDTLEGWGTFAPITVGFDVRKAQDGTPAIDLENVSRRHQGDDYEFDDDAIYLINLTTGVPVPLDLGEGSFQYVIRDKRRYFRNDTRRLEQNLLWETADETVDQASGAPDSARDGYRPEYDTDFDGVLDRPNLLGRSCRNQADLARVLADPVLSDDEKELAEVERDQCLSDGLLTWYERETDTLIARPLIPLDETTEYAVVITDRLVDGAGQPVRSPFDFVYHPSQEAGVARLAGHLSNSKLATYYGDIGGSGLEHVAFTWTFTTQPVVEDLRVIRDGLYGQGPLARLASEFPARAELSRAIGPLDLAIGEAEPQGWQDNPQCRDVWNKFSILRVDTATPAFLQFAASFGIVGPSAEELLRSLANVDHMAIGSFRSPFFISGGPKGTDPNASFNMDFRSGEGELHADAVQFLIAVPKQSPEHTQPFPVAYYGNGYTSSMVEVLGFAGNLAQQGIASIGMNATFHQLVLSADQLTAVRGLFNGSCAAPLANALASGRARDLDGDGTPDSGGDYWTSYLFHTRDVVRQSAVDLLQMFRVLKSFDGRTTTDQDFDLDAPGEQNIAGDFDANGVPDVGGPDVDYYAWGLSLGGILAPFAAALDPKVVAAAPASGSAGLLDVGARTTQGGAFEGIYLRNFGPLVVGVPATELAADETRCEQRAGVASLRFVVVDVNEDREVEFGCLDLPAVNSGAGLPDGGTVVVANRSNGRLRCARVDGTGRFRIGIPSSLGDKLEVALWDAPDAVDSYGDAGCHVSLGREHRVELIRTWGKGLVAPGTAIERDGRQIAICNAPDGCSYFQGRYHAAGDPLLAIAEGFGHIRQTPALRRFINLASNVIDPGDPVNFVPLYSLKPLNDPFGNPQPPKALLNVVTIGDMNVPISSGITLGRVAGAVPFLRPNAVNRYPAHADYATPGELYVELGQKTPNRVLIENHVLEGIARLRRHPPAASCGRNEVPLAPEITACHQACPATACLEGQECVQGRCITPLPSMSECAMSLFDVDVLDEGAALYGEDQAGRPLRLARVAAPATGSTLSTLWRPRLEGSPYRPDEAAWSADQRVAAQLVAYTRPLGEHGFSPTDPCQAWQTGRYMINLLGRFFASGGADVYYLSHPSSHQCLGKASGQGNCPFVLDLSGP
jgi:hypothetical protein